MEPLRQAGKKGMSRIATTGWIGSNMTMTLIFCKCNVMTTDVLIYILPDYRLWSDQWETSKAAHHRILHRDHPHQHSRLVKTKSLERWLSASVLDEKRVKLQPLLRASIRMQGLPGDACCRSRTRSPYPASVGSSYPMMPRRPAPSFHPKCSPGKHAGTGLQIAGWDLGWLRFHCGRSVLDLNLRYRQAPICRHGLRLTRHKAISMCTPHPDGPRTT